MFFRKLRSCRMAMATLPDSKVDWAACMHDYNHVRELIAAVYPGIYADFNERIQAPRGFHLDIPPRAVSGRHLTGRPIFWCCRVLK